MASTKIILWTGMLLATAATYSFLSNSHYKILRFLRFPTVFVFPTTLYFIMEFNLQEKKEFINKFLTFLPEFYNHFDIQKVSEFFKGLPLPFWLIIALAICALVVNSITTSFFEAYHQQNEYAFQSTSAVLHTVDHIATSVQGYFQIVSTSLQAASQTAFASLQTASQFSAGVTFSSHFPIICLCILFFMGIVLLIASLLFSKGKQQWAFALIAVILAAPVSYWVLFITTT
ncbi:hypothetical protein EAE99_011591 [Botrytis elliptica]|nr:hypothetical protein EAE99_011591 [Botrytis elliptica]